MDIKDKDRLISAIGDQTLEIVPEQATKKVAYVKASKQHYVGMIVGKKGSNIMQKRNQTNTEVQNPQQDDDPVFRVTGDNYQDLLDMCLWILRQDDRLSGKDSHNDSQKIEAKIWCCSKYVGLLVGPNGETIRQIKEHSRCCSIQSPPRTERVKCFAVTGSLEEINIAFAKMWDLIEKKYRMDNSTYINSFKSCECANKCERLKLIHPIDPIRPNQFGVPYNYQSTSPEVTTPSHPFVSQSPVQMGSAKDHVTVALQEYFRQVYGVVPPQGSILPAAQTSPTIPGSRVFSGTSNNSSQTSSRSSPSSNQQYPVYRRPDDISPQQQNLNYRGDISPINMLEHSEHRTSPPSNIDQDTLRQIFQLLQITQINQSQDTKPQYSSMQQALNDSPDFGNHYNSYTREISQRGSRSFPSMFPGVSA